jgi:hypothetical protein
MAKAMSFVTAMKDYFNTSPSLYSEKPLVQTPSEFLQELKKLTDDDKAWFRQHLGTVGYEIQASV